MDLSSLVGGARQRWLVTGAAGFIGAATARALLARGDTVVGLADFNDYYDPALKEARARGLAGLPTTLRIDKAGQERARLEGGANWDTPAAIAMVKALAA